MKYINDIYDCLSVKILELTGSVPDPTEKLMEYGLDSLDILDLSLAVDNKFEFGLKDYKEFPTSDMTVLDTAIWYHEKLIAKLEKGGNQNERRHTDEY